jgi:hypothetical protein
MRELVQSLQWSRERSGVDWWAHRNLTILDWEFAMTKDAPRRDEEYVGNDGTPSFYTIGGRPNVADGDKGLLRHLELGAMETMF